ncbi:hypothetical protein ACQUW5_06340 [Legionella sp. CNM-1927-20]|uniref:hypothetical protein n=1 Tax=Legionella sp. CNM-1927-20 TaxID=3422221 RepID=UPI00403A836B
MNKTILGFSILMAGSVAFASSNNMNTNANNNQVKPTDLHAPVWMCTTNASSSDVQADKMADEKMAQQKMSVEKAFEFAAKNCRDCTKITCEVQADSTNTNTNTTNTNTY